MHLGHEVGAGLDEPLVAALEVGPPEVVRAQPEQLEVRAHGAVEDDDALVQRLQIRGRRRVETAQKFGGGGHEDSRLPVPSWFRNRPR